MPTPIPLAEFSSRASAFARDGGAWLVIMQTTEPIYTTLTGSICGDVSSCLYTSWTATTTNTMYPIDYSTNISIPLDQYGDIDSVNFNWSFNVEWASSKVSQGTSIGTLSTFGFSQAVFRESISADDYNALTSTRNTWVSSPFRRSGSVPIQKYGDPKLGYVSLVITTTMPIEPGASIAYYLKGATFEVTNPIVNPSASSSSSTSNTASSSSSTSGTSSNGSSTRSTDAHSELGGLPGLSGGASPLSSGGVSVGSAGGGNGSAGTAAATPKTAVIAGVVASLVGLVLLVLAIWLVRRRKQKRRMGLPAEPFTPIQDMDHSTVNISMSDRDRKQMLEGAVPAASPLVISPLGAEKRERQYVRVVPTESSYSTSYQSYEAALLQASGSSRGERSGSGYAFSGETNEQGRQPSSAHQPFLFTPSSGEVTRETGHYPTPSEKSRLHQDATLENAGTVSHTHEGGQEEEEEEEDGQPATSMIMSPASEIPPPPYFMTTSAGARLGLVGHSSSRPETLEELGRRYRPLIPVELEAKLRRARYLPTDDPDTTPEDVWSREYGVGPLELARLRRLYQMNVPGDL